MSGHTTTIGADTRLSGSISGNGELAVHGAVNGDVHLEGDLTVADSGSVDGDVTAAKLALDGHVSGGVRARQVELGSKARLSGTVDSPRISIHPSARVDARFDMPLSLPRHIGSGRR